MPTLSSVLIILAKGTGLLLASVMRPRKILLALLELSALRPKVLALSFKKVLFIRLVFHDIVISVLVDLRYFSCHIAVKCKRIFIDGFLFLGNRLPGLDSLGLGQAFFKRDQALAVVSTYWYRRDRSEPLPIISGRGGFSRDIFLCNRIGDRFFFCKGYRLFQGVLWPDGYSLNYPSQAALLLF